MIAAFQDRLVRLTKGYQEETKATTVTCERLAFDVNSRHLSSAGTVVFDNLPHTSVEWEIWAIAIAMEHVSGLFKPYILLGQGQLTSTHASSSVMYLATVNKKDIVMTTCLKFPEHVMTQGYSHNKDDISVAILDGPYVCFITGSSIYISPPPGYQSPIPATLCHTDLFQSITDFPCSSIRHVWQQCLEQNLLLVLGIVNVHSEEYDEMETNQHDQLNNLSSTGSRVAAFFLTFDKSADCTNLACIPFDTSCFISDVFSSVITAIKMIKCSTECSQVAEQKDGVKEHILNISVKSCTNHLYCCTSHNQVMEWKDGQLRNWTAIPFGDGNSIQTCEVSMGDVYIIILSDSGVVCVVNATSFQVCHHLEGIRYAFVGDFLGSCCDQAMFIRDEDATLPPLQWKDVIITDFSYCFFNMPNKEEHALATEETSDGTSDGLESAVQALEARLQAGLSCLQEAERMLELKSSLSSQTTAAIRNIVLGQRNPDLTACKVGLVPLVSGHKAKPLTSEACSTQERPSSHEKEEVIVHGDIWWRIVENHIVIAAVVHNTSQRVMKDIQLLASTKDIISRGAPRESRSSLLMANQTNISKTTVEDTLLEPIVKKARIQSETLDARPGLKLSVLQPNQTATVVMVTDCPVFTQIDGHVLNLLLSWVWGTQINLDKTYVDVKEPNFKEHFGSTVDEMQTSVEHLGQVTVHAKDILSQSHHLVLDSDSSECSDTWQIFLALEASQECYQLEVKSAYTSLGQKFQHVLTDCLKFEYYEALTCYICTAPSHPLYLSRMEMKTIKQNNIHLLTHTRDDKQLLLLVHALYDVLPDDVLILSGNRNNKHEALENALQAIQRETTVASRSLRNMIEDSKTKNEAMDSKFNSKEDGVEEDRTDVNSIREEFQARRRHLLAGSHTGHISGKAYGDLVAEMIQLGLHTDEQVQVLERACVKQPEGR